MIRSITLRPLWALRFLAHALFVGALTCLAGAGQSELMDQKAQAGVAEQIGAMLDERYVFPDVAKKCAAHLLELSSSGAFSRSTDPEAFALRLTEALQSVCEDKHLLVRVRAAQSDAEPSPTAHPLKDRLRRRERDRGQNFGFEKVERLEGNVGYLDLRSFTLGQGAIDTAVAVMAILANSDAIIFDLRENSGGHPGMVQFLCSHLFDRPTHLNSLYFREGDQTQEFWTHGVPGAALPEVPVFVLTSTKTFSAAEEFGYNLQAQKRATLVGEATRGGAHPGGLFPIDDQFEMVIPTGRAINPVTGTNWEGTGVLPQVPVPASEALKAALELARPAAEARRSQVKGRWEVLETMHAGALELAGKGNAPDASAAMREEIELGRKWGMFDESSISAMGHDLLEQKRQALALVVFTVNHEAFPESLRAKDELKKAQTGK